MGRWVRMAALCGVGGIALFVVNPLGASADQLFSETFANPTVSNTNFVSGTTSGAGSFAPCLTASTATAQTPIPGCAAGQPGIPAGGDAAGSGALRLTDNTNTQATFVIDNQARPFSAGLLVDFDFYSYDTGSGTPADGIVFFLSDGSVNVTQPGGSGGSLGYGPFTTTPGVAGGYLGIGFDEYGNYENPVFNGTGCAVAAPSQVPNQVGIRGPGSGTAGYCILAASGPIAAGNLANAAATTRTAANTRRHAHIVVDPPSVTAPKVTVTVDFGSGPVQVVQTPEPANPPATFKFGFTAGTGALNDIHEVQNLTVATAQALPQLTLTNTSSGTFVQGAGGSFTLTAAVAASAGPEDQPVTITDTLPAGLTVASLPTGAGWNCSATALGSSTVSCTYPATPSSPIAAGTVLPPITANVAVASTASGPLTATATANSVDAANGPVTAAATVAITPAPVVPVPATGAGARFAGGAAAVGAGLVALLGAEIVRRRQPGARRSH